MTVYVIVVTTLCVISLFFLIKILIKGDKTEQEIRNEIHLEFLKEKKKDIINSVIKPKGGNNVKTENDASTVMSGGVVNPDSE